MNDRYPHPGARPGAAYNPDNARGGGYSAQAANGAYPGAPGMSLPASHPACEAIQRATQRLIEVVDQETIALRDHTATDLSEYNNRKAHGLLELDRAVTLLNGQQPDGGTLGLLRQLRDKLDANSRVLAMHIEAVREIAGVIADTIREADSDGTYTHAYRSKG